MPEKFETENNKKWKTNNLIKTLSTSNSHQNNENEHIMRKTIKVNSNKR